MAIGVLDLSIITDRLIKTLNDAIDHSPLWTVNGGTIPKFTIQVSGAMPEAVRADGGCWLSLYLYHVNADKNQRNSPIAPYLVPQRPFGLELYYLLTAFANKDYVQEQQAMSIGMRCFFDNPFVRDPAMFEELSLTMQMEPAEKLSVQWQAISAPFRLTAVYRVAIAFLEPLIPARPDNPHPTTWTLSADPAALPVSKTGQVLGTFRRATYLSPDSTTVTPKTIWFDQSPATVAPGQDFTLYGAGLNGSASSSIFLVMPDGSETEVTAWKTANPAVQTDSRIGVTLPATVGAVPANAPPAGIYQLRAGGGATKTNATPFSVAAVVAQIANPPLLTGAGPHTIHVIGLVAGKTEILLDTLALTESAGAPSAGQFQVDTGAGTVTLLAPNILSTGRYTLRLRVNGVESQPSWWVVL
ncbi:MAG TPA: Pvc16 family protein [Bryobacteraceae bacterium]|nr:Pvc16 family protein [Bryobacteraceae bacterium]